MIDGLLMGPCGPCRVNSIKDLLCFLVELGELVQVGPASYSESGLVSQLVGVDQTLTKTGLRSELTQTCQI